MPSGATGDRTHSTAVQSESPSYLVHGTSRATVPQALGMQHAIMATGARSCAGIAVISSRFSSSSVARHLLTPPPAARAAGRRAFAVEWKEESTEASTITSGRIQLTGAALANGVPTNDLRLRWAPRRLHPDATAMRRRCDGDATATWRRAPSWQGGSASLQTGNM